MKSFRSDGVDLAYRVEGLDPETVVLSHSHSVDQPPSPSCRMADAIPGARLSVIRGAGHLTTVEQPRAVRDVVLPFLAGEGGSLQTA